MSRWENAARVQFGPASQAGWRHRWFHIIFDHDEPASRRFDVWLIVAILASVLITVLDSVVGLDARFGALFYGLEWAFTLLFLLEYLLRIAVVDRPLKYMFSFFGIVDILAVMPTFLSLFLAGSQYLLVVRALRIMRIFRILKMTRYVDESNMLWSAMLRARHKIFVFISAILTLVLIFGALMYLIEGPANGFSSIPKSMYWAVVTMTTVGFGDITPHTPLGQFVTSLIMLVGYGIIAVPSGIFVAELAVGLRETRVRKACAQCGLNDHEADARYCRGCGQPLSSDSP